MERFEPPVVGDAETMLFAFLEYHRATLELKCAGLTNAEAAKAAVPPSPLSLLGIVRHMTDVEQIWFGERFLGVSPTEMYRTAEDPDAPFHRLEEADLAASIARWRSACDASRHVVAQATSLDQLSIGIRARTGEHVSLRWLLFHLVEEYARHNGHADLLREAIDGVTGI